jgi:hypothetical protein
MKLNLIFIVMELLTLLAYLIVFVQSKLGSFSGLKQRIPVANLSIIVPIRQGK